MRPLYHELKSQIEVFTKENVPLPPHLHKYLEYIYITEGSMGLKIQDIQTEMHCQDLAIIFPDTIHQFDIDRSAPSQAIYVLASPSLAGSFCEILQKSSPSAPVIRREILHPDIPYAINSLLGLEQSPFFPEMQQAYFQILLARTLPLCRPVQKKEPESPNLVWQTASYIARHFTEDISLFQMARSLCTSPYKLSRIFSGIFHMNFNQYLNEIRLDYASHLLRTTDISITDIYISSGFASQTTFNRAFKAKYLISPRDYRRQIQQELSPARLPKVRQETKDENFSTNSPWIIKTGRFL